MVDKTAKPRSVRYGRVAAGLTLLPIGAALLVLPGPGIPVVLGSLMLLEGEFVWAGRARSKIQTWMRDGADWVQQRRNSG